MLFKRILTWLLVGALAAALLYLLAERNQRQWGVEQRGKELLVLRGRFFPFGLQPFQSDDKVLSAAYAPIKVILEPPPGLSGARFGDREELDRALYHAFRVWIDILAQASEREKLGQALELIHRAELLGGLNDEQRRELSELQVRTAYYEGRAKLEDAMTLLREGVAKLRVASEARGGLSREAGELYDKVREPVEQVVRLVRGATAVPPTFSLPSEAEVPVPAPVVPAAAPAMPAEKPAAAEKPAPDAGM